MTLRRQLTLIIATLFVLLFIGTFSINVHNTRAYLNDQLNSISQDMATSLGLTLSPYMADDDMVVVESHTMPCMTAVTIGKSSSPTSMANL